MVPYSNESWGSSPLCSRCGKGHETPSHLFENCVTLAAVKYSIFGSTMTTLEQVVRGGRLCELLRFVTRAALCCWLSSWWFSTTRSFFPTLLEAGRPAHLTGTCCPFRFHFSSWLPHIRMGVVSCTPFFLGYGQWVIGPEPWLVPALL